MDHTWKVKFVGHDQIIIVDNLKDMPAGVVEDEWVIDEAKRKILNNPGNKNINKDDLQVESKFKLPPFGGGISITKADKSEKKDKGILIKDGTPPKNRLFKEGNSIS